MPHLHRAALLLGFLCAGSLILAGLLDRNSPEINAALVQEASERKALPPSEIAYWRRHERNQALCRGQTYVAQCCDSSFDRAEPTCLNVKDIQ